MSEDKASAALRLSIRAVIGATPGDPASLRNIITNIFPDGALCFVLENRALYQLDKESTATPDNLTIVLPIGGPGRWLLFGQSSGAASLVEIVGTAENSALFTGVTTHFIAIDGAAFDWQPTGAPAGFTLTAAGGVITYSGAEATRARISFTGSVFLEGSEVSGLVWAAIAHNEDVLGADPTTSFLPGTQASIINAADFPQIVSSERTLVLAPGDTVQIALATSASVDMNLSRGTLSVSLG